MASTIASWFGYKQMPKITKQDRAILDLKHQRDKVKVYQRKIQVILDQEEQVAKEALRAGNKEKARRALRRRKYQENLLQQTDGQLEQLEQLVSNIEFSLIEASVLHGLKQGNEVLAQIHKEMSIENVEKLMSETREAIEYQKEIDELLSSKMSADEEEEVMKELQALQDELTPPTKFPVVPDTVPVDKETNPEEPEWQPVPSERQPEEARVALAA
ncbi:Snf7-domain-containing protein [Serendipita vermifera]|nr:Snf7-domain-containing protein [Serendipita vermifera]